MNSEQTISKLKVTRESVVLTETPVSKMSWENLLARREAVIQVLENLEAEKQILSDEFLARLQEEKISGKVIGNWSISKATRYGFDTTLEQAQELGAVKTVVDQMALKKLFQKGIDIPGAKKTEYCMVREVTKSE